MLKIQILIRSLRTYFVSDEPISKGFQNYSENAYLTISGMTANRNQIAVLISKIEQAMFKSCSCVKHFDIEDLVQQTAKVDHPLIFCSHNFDFSKHQVLCTNLKMNFLLKDF